MNVTAFLVALLFYGIANAQGCKSMIEMVKLLSSPIPQSDQPVVEQHVNNFCNDYAKVIADNKKQSDDISQLQTKIDMTNVDSIKQCKVQIEATWGNCAPSQQGNKMPIVETSLTPLKGGYSEWSPWQIASSWNGGPYNCIRTRLYCK